MNQDEKTRFLTNPDNWTKARLQALPRPTYWPFFLALGLTFVAVGLLTTWLISEAGLVGLAIALTGWITELRHERHKKRNERR